MSQTRPELGRQHWRKLRAQALKRDGYRCVICQSEERLQVHHIVRPKAGGRDVLDNVVTLCVRHHGQAHRRPHRRTAGAGKRIAVRGGNNDSTTKRDPVPRRRFLSPSPSPNFPPSSTDVSDDPGDDPEAGIYWAPPSPSGMHRRWSRPWFEWRGDPRFTP
jgi:hypothetical protein